MSASAQPVRYTTRPIVFVSLLICGSFVAALAFAAVWAVDRLDSRAMMEENRSLSVALAEEKDRLALEQDSSAVWDDAVVNIRANNQPWIAENLTEWMSDYFDHDRVYVIAPDGHVVRAAKAGTYAGMQYDPQDKAIVEAMVTRVRTSLQPRVELSSTATSDTSGLVDTVRLPEGQLAFVSVRLIMPTTDAVVQAAGTEYLHVSVKLIGEKLLADLSHRFGMGSLLVGGPDKNRASLPLLGRDGNVVGFIVWTPHRPALVLLRETAPATLGILCLSALSVGGLLAWLRRTTAQLEDTQSRLTYLAFYDPLTGAASRTLFDARLREALTFEYLAKSRVALFSIDLDHFKEVNDTFGHAAGDQLIQQVAGRLASGLGEDTTLTRLGGDEFALVQPGVVGDGHARWLCQNLLNTFRDPFVLKAGVVQVTASLGVALEFGDAVTGDELMRRADVALYAAKGAGRNCFAIYSPEMDRSRRERRTLEIDLRNALLTGTELFLVYQPVFNARSGNIEGAEALIRWDHPSRGLLAPDVFIGIAEQTGLIEALGMWALEEACQNIASSLLPWVAVNISPVQFRDPDLASQILGKLQKYGLSTDRLELEITEGLLLQNSPIVQTTLAQLRAAGIRIALDDFGTGYSSISYLRTYAVDKLKIDQSFIRSIGRDDATDVIIRSVIEMARGLHLTVTAEGVEDEMQRRLLTALGCDTLQGYLLSRPVTSERLAVLLLERLPAA